MASSTGSLVRRRTLGVMLKKARKAQGLTLKHVSMATKITQSRMSRIENGDAQASREDLDGLTRIYKVHKADLEEFYDLLPEEDAAPKPQPWYVRYADALSADMYQRVAFEVEATQVFEYLPLGIPGLLQTREYAATTQRGGFVSMGEDLAADHTQIRMERQKRLAGDSPLTLAAYVTEASLYLQRGAGPIILRDQILRLAEEAKKPHITVRVVPNTAGPTSVYSCGVSLLLFPEQAPPVIYFDVVGASVMRDNERDTERMRRVFAELDRHALSQEESLGLFTRRAKEIQ